MALVVIEKVRPHVALIRLNRPERLNAMSFELVTELCRACEEVGADNSCWVVVLTGEGRGFCSGLDLEDPGVIPGIEEMALSRVGMLAMSHFSKVVPALRAMPQPVIAAINGCAYGGGLCLSLGADARFCAESAVFNATGIVNGLTSTELGASYLLPRTVGLSRSNDMLLTGRKVGAREAERIGLVSRIYPDAELVERAIEAAEEMCEFSAFGLQMTKKVCWANVEATSLTAAIDLEDRNQLILGNTENLVECIEARREKRKPVYTDLPRTDLKLD
ncbi:MAG: enoyl-CoA hydratase/isomerase family protein [Deltaproteobacteria bacterium]|nr:enoyl-CoA hydratase/isomerase family protein [Deltaproteobacteria bacterium]MBW2371607.1 enoyl-CoA hydratase/isomerase family protein [Deltaproteobacteria bacterium]